MSTTEPPRPVVLFVCTANICRSPMAQLVLQDALTQTRLAGAETVDVRSAGLYAQDDTRIAEMSAALLAQRSIDSTAFRSRRLTPELIRDADLVLTAAMGHRGAVVEMCPSASSHTFTLLELAWLLADVPALAVRGDDMTERLSSLVDLARGQRGLRMPDRDLDLADPYGRRKRAYRRTLAEIDEAVATIVDRLAGRPPGVLEFEPPPPRAKAVAWRKARHAARGDHASP